MRDWLQPAVSTVSAAAATALAAGAVYWLVRLTGSTLSRRIQEANAMISFLEKWISASHQLGANEESDKLARERLAAVLNSVWSEYESAVLTSESSRRNPLREVLLLYRPKRPRTWVPQIGFYVSALMFAVAIYKGFNGEITPSTEYLPFFALLLSLFFRSIVFYSEQRG